MAFANDNVEKHNYFITEAYNYPIVPEMAEWAELKSLSEMIEVCQIPENILNNMTTEALIETVINYPLLINMFAYDKPQQGFKEVSSYFNGLQELVNRDDVSPKLETFVSRMSVKKDYSSLNSVLARVIMENLQIRDDVADMLRLEYHYNYTPNGTRVQFIYNLTWADHGITAEYADQLNEEYKLRYKNATPKREENPAYNCHSYAWYSTSSGNLYWLNGGYAAYYMSDGSYTEVTSAKSGDKVWYGSSDHSAIVSSVSGGTVTVISKWGALGLFEHSVEHCPYSSSNVSYWRR